MNIVAELSQWWNLIYAIPFCLGVVLVLLSVLGAGRHGLGGHHAGHGLGHGHAGAGHSASHAGHAHGAHGHASHGHGSHGQHGHAGHGQDGRAQGTEAALPVASAEHIAAESAMGKVPWSLPGALHIQNIPPLMLLQNFMLFWGIFGWSANQFFGKTTPDPARFIVPSLLSTVAGSLVITLILSAVMSQFTPSDETSVVTKRDLEGCLGEAVSAITDRMGSVYAHDAVGTLHHLPCRIAPDGKPIAKGEQVLVIEYHPAGDYYRVKSWKPEEQFLTANEHE